MESADTLSIQSVGYYRQLWQGHVDGNSTDAQPCDPALLPGQLCIGDGATPINQKVPTPNTLPPTAALGEIDRNWTELRQFRRHPAGNQYGAFV